jgi:hypothetical protein
VRFCLPEAHFLPDFLPPSRSFVPLLGLPVLLFSQLSLFCYEANLSGALPNSYQPIFCPSPPSFSPYLLRKPIIGGHSHTDPSKKTQYSGIYEALPTMLANTDGDPVLVTQAYRYNTYLGEVVIGLKPDGTGGYDVVTKAGRYLGVVLASTVEDAATKAIVDPYNALLAAYNAKKIGQTLAPIDALAAYTQETNGANMQADASVYELGTHGITVDFHLSGAMTNAKIANTATPTLPYTLTIANMFSLMPYENSLVTMMMNGPQLKAVLERAYRNYYYYKYVPGYGGYSYYTTCMIDINSGGNIVYRDAYPTLPDGNNVVSLKYGSTTVDFTDATKYYKVSTVNYLAAGSCNFNNSGVSLWPLNQIVDDTQYYVRDAMIDYATAMGTVNPQIEGRLKFNGTLTSVTSSNPHSTYGNAVTFTATVVGGATAPTGSVQFKINGTKLGTPVTLVNGVATYTTPYLAAANYTVTAEYAGSVNNLASTGKLVSGQEVSKAPVMVNVASSANPSMPDESVELSVSVGPAGTVLLAPTGPDTPDACLTPGQVTLKMGATELGTATLNAYCQATFVLVAPLPSGTYPFTVEYGGGLNYLTGTSSILEQVVNHLIYIPAIFR